MWKLCHCEETSCTWEEFLSGVDVWIRRPNVLNRRLVGVVHLLECPLSPAWGQQQLDLSHMTVSQLQCDGGAQVDETMTSKILVREILPRERRVTSSSHELVVIGMGL